jgi:hypothetical protein
MGWLGVEVGAVDGPVSTGYDPIRSSWQKPSSEDKTTERIFR